MDFGEEQRCSSCSEQRWFCYDLDRPLAVGATTRGSREHVPRMLKLPQLNVELGRRDVERTPNSS